MDFRWNMISEICLTNDYRTAKMIHLYQICLKNFSFPQTLRYSFNKGNSNNKLLYRSVCNAETCNDKLNIPESSLYLSPFRAIVLGPFWASIFKFWNYYALLRITDEGSVPEMWIWSILLIKSDLKWCIYLSRSLVLYFNYLVSVTAGGPVSPRGHM